MENEPNSPRLAIQELSQRFQGQPLGNLAKPNNDDEGGLNLGQVVGALRRRMLVIAGVTTVVALAALLKARNSKPIYQAGFEILTMPVTVETQVISSVPQTLSNKEEQQASKGVDPTKLKLLKSPKILMPIVQQLQPKYPDVNYDVLAAGLVVTPTPNSEILSVSYQDQNPRKVKEVLEHVADSYLKYSLEERLADVQQGIDFVNAQLPQLQKRVEISQDKLQSFRQQYNLIDPDSQGKQLADQTNKIVQQRLDTQLALNETRTVYDSLSRELLQAGDSAASSVLSNSARYQKLLDKLLEIKAQAATDSSLFRENSPNIQVLQDQQKNLLPLIQQEGSRVQAELASKIQELEARRQILSQTEAALNQSIKQLSVISRQYTDIQRELKIATDNLDQFLTKREALRIDAGQRKTPWQILTPPADPSPSSADVKRSAILGAILGLLLGVGVALLLEKLSNVLHSAEELKSLTKLPILGVIPHNSELVEIERQLISLEKLTALVDVAGLVQQMQQRLSLEGGSRSSYHYRASPFVEAFRSLYANILLLSPDTRIRSLVISSSLPGEGKSTVSVYLAQAAAALGQRVLLVDADLRLPKLHQRLELDNTYGLSTIIADDLDFERVVQKSPLDSNLSILTSGQIPPDPTKVLSSQKMQSLMERFKEAYDLIIYDMPPVQGLADAKLLAPKVDGVVMVAGLNKTKAAVITQTLDSLRLSSVNVLGLIANGSKEQADNIYSAYHQYYAAAPNKSMKDMIQAVSKLPNDSSQ